MTTKSLIDFLAAEADVSKKDAAAMLKALPKAIETALIAEKRVVLPNVASFKLVHKAARMGRNPQTGAALEIKARNVAKITPVGDLSKAIAATV
ncbi:HU family DNA-binding protein [Pseudomonas putida]|uniref:HU family DNA-binding protein n=1 Tax=Pseudomonas putida TaxID=303 RepID=A0A8I1EAL3_PSEPU|nr:HU family DNA-binding protein [Pseudomonas putida]MBI6882929.1 HU family DNA-binding protein [Pseudomonas putida]